MSITFKGERKASGANRTSGVISAERILLFFADNKEQPIDILKDSNIPADRSQHPVYPGLVCKSVVVNKVAGEKSIGAFIATCNYTDDPGELPQFQLAEKPWNQPPFDYRESPIENIENTFRAYKPNDQPGNPTQIITNTAGEILETKVNNPNILISFKYNVRKWSDSWTLDFFDSINKFDLTVCNKKLSAEKALIRKLDPRLLDYKGAAYYQVGVEIEVTKKDFLKRIPNEGLYFLDKSKTPNRVTRIWEDDGVYGAYSASFGVSAVDVPQALAKDGSLLNVTKGADQTPPIQLEFQVKESRDWATLGLPKKRN